MITHFASPFYGRQRLQAGWTVQLTLRDESSIVSRTLSAPRSAQGAREAHFPIHRVCNLNLMAILPEPLLRSNRSSCGLWDYGKPPPSSWGS